MSAVPNPNPPVQPKGPLPAAPSLPEEPKRGGPWKSLIALAVVGLLGYLGYQWYTQPATDTTVFASVKTATAVQGNVEHQIRLSGQTSARDFNPPVRLAEMRVRDPGPDHSALPERRERV